MNNRRIKSLLVGIAGYLHDIGKISQKTGFKLTGHEKYSDIILGNKKGYYHAIFTHKLLDAVFSKNNNYKYLNAAWSASFGDIEDIIMTASIHHNPPSSNKAAQCIKKGDCLAAGLDRDMAEDKVLHEKIKNYKQAKLTSILSIIHTESAKYPEPSHYEQLIVNSNNIFPKPLSEDSVNHAETRYSMIETSLISGLNLLLDNMTSSDEESLRRFADGIEGLMLSHASLVPAATTDKDLGVSLYEHSKLTAAFAAAMSNGNRDDCKPFLLIRGEFFSIQKFIFNKEFSNKNPAKILRGKSFYVSLMTEAAALMFIDALDLPVFNILQNGAGKFIILGANTPEYVEKASRVKNAINTWLYERFYGQVSFGLSIEEAANSDFQIGRFDELWLKLLHDSDIEKASRFDLLSRHSVFGNYHKKFESDGAALCEHCMLDVATASGSCSNCNEYEDIGKKLTDSNILTFYKDSAGFFGAIGYYFNNGIGSYLSSISIDMNLGFDGRRVTHYKNYVLKDIDGDVVSFEKLAQVVKGAELLGVLKADVDNLGTIFAYGLSEDVNSKFISNQSFSRFNAISRNVHLFFTYYLSFLMHSKAYNVYTVFSGGDDLFLIGAYKDIISLALDIEQELRRYTGGNSDITISAGVGLFKVNTPIWFMADETERMLEHSKSSGKNRITILGATAKWDSLRAEQSAFDAIFQTVYDGKDASTAFFYKLMNLANMSIQFNKMKDAEALMWRPYMRYLTARQDISDEKRAQFALYLENRLSATPELFKALIQIELYKNRRKEGDNE